MSDRGERPEFMRIEYPTARKSHSCCECKGAILNGETYQRVSGVWSGGLGLCTFKTCFKCARLRDEYDARNHRDDSADFEELHECLREEARFITAPTPKA